ncbi:hypothetical protein M0L20_21975 [Spirosoma sp. RP8]|uniref:Uncharacterized protein n=1 Tax=Spirosoma liriopis TaxID=2937440 RepID=A0ABT0HQT9_9BACT|nr:hypothetical protein [Spirosoma liriopis]MCK8494553.1 hypothetical protein [Spirosoma liriopis]
METSPDHSTSADKQPQPAQQQVEAATNFLETCDRLSTGYDNGFYWDDVQRALRIAAGIENWPE